MGGRSGRYALQLPIPRRAAKGLCADVRGRRPLREREKKQRTPHLAQRASGSSDTPRRSTALKRLPAKGSKQVPLGLANPWEGRRAGAEGGAERLWRYAVNTVAPLPEAPVARGGLAALILKYDGERYIKEIK